MNILKQCLPSVFSISIGWYLAEQGWTWRYRKFWILFALIAGFGASILWLAGVK